MGQQLECLQSDQSSSAIVGRQGNKRSVFCVHIRNRRDTPMCLESLPPNGPLPCPPTGTASPRCPERNLPPPSSYKPVHPPTTHWERSPLGQLPRPRACLLLLLLLAHSLAFNNGHVVVTLFVISWNCLLLPSPQIATATMSIRQLLTGLWGFSALSAQLLLCFYFPTPVLGLCLRMQFLPASIAAILPLFYSCQKCLPQPGTEHDACPQGRGGRVITCHCFYCALSFGAHTLPIRIQELRLDLF